MTNKQRRKVKRDYGITVPSDVPVRLLEAEDDNSIILHVFPVPGREPWVPFGAKKVEPGELDAHGRSTVMYYFEQDQPKKRRGKKRENRT